MTDFFSRVETHFATKRSIKVPEWKDEQGQPSVIYWSPITPTEFDSVVAMSQAKGEPASHANLRMLIAKAEDEAGQKLFTIEHLSRFADRSDVNVVTRIIAAMTGRGVTEAALKN